MTDVVKEQNASSFLPDGWELVVGLEVHAELATESKLFSPARNKFGAEPNTNVHPVCLGLPGTLPVVNKKAVELSIRIGLALNCSIQKCVWSRKNYFYPDMPKDYQISQYDKPLNVEGYIDLPSSNSRVGIERAHMEEDTGKLTHIGSSGRIHDASYSLVDYNRSGVPLIEIVSKPDIKSPEQAKEYVEELRSILVAISASDGKMEEGSMRVDANVSVRPVGSDELRTRCEIKNVNSLRSLTRAIEFEALRHVNLYEDGDKPHQETRHWDEAAGKTRSGRSKENAEDYRYFPDPDLVIVNPSDEWVDEIRANLPELPHQMRQRLLDLGLDFETTSIIIQRDLAPLFIEAVTDGAEPVKLAKLMVNNIAVDSSLDKLTANNLAKLVEMELDNKLTSTQSKSVLAEMITSGDGPESIAKNLGYEAMDNSELESIVKNIINNSPDEWQKFCSGDEKVQAKLQGFFVGQVMRETKGQADGGLVNKILNQEKESA